MGKKKPALQPPAMRARMAMNEDVVVSHEGPWCPFCSAAQLVATIETEEFNECSSCKQSYWYEVLPVETEIHLTSREGPRWHATDAPPTHGVPATQAGDNNTETEVDE